MNRYAVTALTEGLRVKLRADGVKTMLACPRYGTGGLQQPVRAGKAPEAVLRVRKRAIRCDVERDIRTAIAPRSGWFLVALVRLFSTLVEARMAEMNGTA